MIACSRPGTVWTWPGVLRVGEQLPNLVVVSCESAEEGVGILHPGLLRLKPKNSAELKRPVQGFRLLQCCHVVLQVLKANIGGLHGL